jgi:hypothetical protein
VVVACLMLLSTVCCCACLQEDGGGQPMISEVSTGIPYLIVPVRGPEALDAVRMMSEGGEAAALEALRRYAGRCAPAMCRLEWHSFTNATPATPVLVISKVRGRDGPAQARQGQRVPPARPALLRLLLPRRQQGGRGEGGVGGHHRHHRHPWRW